MGVNYYFPRWVFLKLYGQTDQKVLNGNNQLPKKESCDDKIGMNKRYVLSVI